MSEHMKYILCLTHTHTHTCYYKTNTLGSLDHYHRHHRGPQQQPLVHDLTSCDDDDNDGICPAYFNTTRDDIHLKSPRSHPSHFTSIHCCSPFILKC